MPFSISAAIGFIAMSDVALLDDMIPVSYIRRLRRKGPALGRSGSASCRDRLRPVLMTTLVASLGFVPMAFATGVFLSAAGCGQGDKTKDQQAKVKDGDGKKEEAEHGW